VKSILLTIDSQTQTAVENPQIGIATKTDTKVKAAVFSMGVVPEPVVVEAIAGRGVKDGLGGLVYWVVIKLGQHGGAPLFLTVQSYSKQLTGD
jgi:hypothetical protein